jgi:FAD/FMN-containing dehydrogenase
VFSPNTTLYNESSTSYFAQQEGELSPYCYVKPASREDVSIIVKTLFQLNSDHTPVCPFAVRGGGHHTVIGIANIHDGITIDLGSINQTILSSDKTIASVGSGARWGSVYSTLVPEGLAVLGGRESDIGVGGFTTGGKRLHEHIFETKSV